MTYTFDRVTVSVDKTDILAETSLVISARRVGVIGANGSGKSTFARLLNGLVAPTTGTVTVDGLNTRKDARLVRHKVGFVFQNPDLQIVMPTVEEDIAFGLGRLKLGAEEKASRVDEVLRQFDLEHLRNRLAHVLSGGEKQRLALAAVLVTKPECIVFDEPLTMLDLRAKRRVADLIDGLEQQVILVTHDLDHLDGFDEVLVLDEGRVIEQASPAVGVAAYLKLASR